MTKKLLVRKSPPGKKLLKGAARSTLRIDSMPPMPKVVGKPDPHMDGHLLVSKPPQHPMFVRLNTDKCPPDTRYRFDKKTGTPVALVSVITLRYGEPMHIAWENCGWCNKWWRFCLCKGGVSAPRSVEYIFDKATAEVAEEEWTYNHRNYLGSFSRKDRELRQNRLDTAGRGEVVMRKYTDRVSVKDHDEEPPVRPSKRLARAGGTQTAPTPPKGLRKPSRAVTPSKPTRDETAEVIKNGRVDKAAVDSAAAASTANLENAVKKLLRKK